MIGGIEEDKHNTQYVNRQRSDLLMAGLKLIFSVVIKSVIMTVRYREEGVPGLSLTV